MAKDEQELLNMCQFTANNVKPGGGALILTVSGEYRPESRLCELMLDRWGWASLPVPDACNMVCFTMGKGDSCIQVVNYQYPLGTYVACLEKAGFEEVQPLPLQAPPGLLEALAAAVQSENSSYGSEAGLAAGSELELVQLYLSNPHVTGFIAKKRL
jgi:hypothetical protein